MRRLNLLTIPAKPPSESDGEYNQISMKNSPFFAKVCNILQIFAIYIYLIHFLTNLLPWPDSVMVRAAAYHAGEPWFDPGPCTFAKNGKFFMEI